MTFDDFELDDDLLDGIDAIGFRSPTPIQEKAIPIILSGRDLIACAQTGTGKTAAFVLPLLQKILESNQTGTSTLIVVPSRELAIQIDQQIEAISYFVNISSIAVYGGGSGDTWIQQKKALLGGADIIIATPGRLIAQMQMGGIDFSSIRHLVLDEADRMMDMGFYDDIMRIVSALPVDRQTLCFSATMPPKIRMLTEKMMRQPEQINIAVSKPASGVQQFAFVVHEEQKPELLLHLLKEGNYSSAIIFASTKVKVKLLETQLLKSGIQTKGFHSDLEQEQREAIMQSFKSRKLPILVGTDVLSRGIDVENIEMVLNYDIPPDPEDYVHRIGRTARAERTGTAFSFINQKDQSRFQRIEKMIDRTIEKLPLPSGFGPAPEYQPRNERSRHRKPFKKSGSAKKK